MIGPVQSRCHKGSAVGKRSLRWEGFVEKVGFEPGVIRPGVSFPRMRDFAHQYVLVFFGEGFLQLATAKGPGRISTQNTPKHAVPPKDVPFRGCEHKISRPIYPRNSAILGTIFDVTKNFRLKIA